MTVRIHPTAEVSPEAIIGAGASTWRQAQVRERANLAELRHWQRGLYRF